MTTNNSVYAVQCTGVLGDKWLSGRGSREDMRRLARFILNKGFEQGQRAVVVSVLVVAVGSPAVESGLSENEIEEVAAVDSEVGGLVGCLAAGDLDAGLAAVDAYYEKCKRDAFARLLGGVK